MRITRTSRPIKVLDFDIENRPLSYWYDGKATAEVTAEYMLKNFKLAYDTADMVTGHYIRKHDLPIINGALMEYDLPLLGPKWTHDTKLDLPKRDGLSMSQEALGAMYGLEAPKHHMTQNDWREANRLTPEGFEKTRERVVSDVIQHKELYQRLRPILKPPKLWKP
jgi:hypothetical protein